MARTRKAPKSKRAVAVSPAEQSAVLKELEQMGILPAGQNVSDYPPMGDPEQLLPAGVKAQVARLDVAAEKLERRGGKKNKLMAAKVDRLRARIVAKHS